MTSQNKSFKRTQKDENDKNERKNKSIETICIKKCLNLHHLLGGTKIGH